MKISSKGAGNRRFPPFEKFPKGDVMAESDGRPDVMELWRTWLRETERQWNSFFNEVMGTDAFGGLISGYLEAYAGLHRLLNRNMERYLATFNLPTRSDIVELGERLRALEERLISLEGAIGRLAAAVGQPEMAPVTQFRPRRTRRPRQEPAG